MLLLFFNNLKIRLLRKIPVNKLLNAPHIALGCKNVGKIGGNCVRIVALDIIIETEFCIDSHVIAEIICLTNCALARDGAICHKSGYITREHIRVETVLYDKGVLAIGLRSARNCVDSVHYAVNESAPVSHYNALFGKGGIIIIDIGQIGAERGISVTAKVADTNDLDVGVGFLEEFNKVIKSSASVLACLEPPPGETKT